MATPHSMPPSEPPCPARYCHTTFPPLSGSRPKDDAQFLTYVTNPTLPALLGVVLNANVAPINLPRTDLATTFLTGITGVNKPMVNPQPSANAAPGYN